MNHMVKNRHIVRVFFRNDLLSNQQILLVMVLAETIKIRSI